MRLTIKSSIDVTPSLETYIEEKFASLEKFVKHFEDDGKDVEIWLELGRSKHHNKGEVFTASADLRLPKKVIHAEASGEEDIRKAVDHARDTLRLELEKHKAKMKPKRGDSNKTSD